MKRLASVLGGLTLLGTLAGGCIITTTDDDDDDGSGGSDTVGATTATTKASSAANTTTSVTTTTASSTADASSSSTGLEGCTAVEWTFSKKLVDGEGGSAALRGVLTPNFGEAANDLLQVEFFVSDDTGQIDLGSGVNTNYSTCHECFHAIQDAASATPREFFQVSGSIDVVDGTMPTAGDIQFQAANITLVEVTIDPATYVSTPVPGGACLTIESIGGAF